MRLVLAFLVLALVGLAMAMQYLPWWGSVLLLAALVAGGILIAKWSFRRLLTAPFKMKGAVLRDASLEIHSVTAVPAPTVPSVEAGSGEELDDEPAETESVEIPPKGWNYYQLVTTITPQPSTGNFTHWEPGEMELVLPDLDARDLNEDNDDCTIYKLEIEQGGQFQPDDGSKFNGPVRLRFTVAVRPEVRTLIFRYYFESFGQISLPDPISRAA